VIVFDSLSRRKVVVNQPGPDARPGIMLRDSCVEPSSISSSRSGRRPMKRINLTQCEVADILRQVLGREITYAAVEIY